MHTETMDRQAFELVAQAVERIDDYNRDHQLSFLQHAESALNQALTRDAQYLDACLYSGIVKDLIGKPADAVPFFDKILNNLPTDSKDLWDEVQYSRGVAWYHQYSHRKLERAEKDFLAVVEGSKNSDLRMLAHAGLAQTYAMWMIPDTAQKDKLRAGRGAAELKFIEEKHQKCLDEITLVRFQKPSVPPRPKQPSSLLSGPIQGTVLNAAGMCNMYWTDYNITDNNERRKLLNEAIGYLQEADKYLPGDWANTCDIGSVHFRLGVVTRESGGNPDKEFQTAMDLFQKVVDDLRPNYGFAWYEMGRIYRVWKKFNEAKNSFAKSLAIPVEYRDVGDSTLNAELARAQDGDSNFP